MDDQSQRFRLASIIWPGVVVAVLGYYGYVRLLPRMESARPEDPASAQRSADASASRPAEVQTRLWEDPLGEQYRELAARQVAPAEPPPWFLLCWGDRQIKLPSPGQPGVTPSPPRPAGLQQIGDLHPPLRLGRKPLLLPVMVPGGTSIDDREKRMRTRYAAIAALATGKYRPAAADRIEHFRLPIERSSLVIPYELFLPDIVDPVYDDADCAHFSSVLLCWLNEDALSAAPLAAIRALLQEVDRARPREKVKSLVAIVAEHVTRFFGGKAAASAVPEGTIRSPEGLYLHVIGPSNTNTLFKMALEQPYNESRRFKESKDGAVFFSARATLEPHCLKYRTKFFTDQPVKDLVMKFVGSKGCNGVRFVPVIGTDWHLLHALHEELEARKAWPNERCENECLVLVTEKDTFYGRALPFLFSRFFPPHPLGTKDFQAESGGRIDFRLKKGLLSERFPENFIEGQVEGDWLLNSRRERVGWRRYYPKEEDDCDPSKEEVWDIWLDPKLPQRSAQLRVTVENARRTRGELRVGEPIVVYRYLRGMDGLQTSKAASTSRGRAESDLRGLERSAGYDPTGTVQVDYLRRLGDELEELNRRQRRHGGRGILAIGVTGTDVYDKLLVLRALRRRFPNVCFFTTDLDANLSRLSELDYTRNMVVASHFALTLHPSLQRDVPPFRDSYQTSTFLATLLAIQDDRAEAAVGWRHRPSRPRYESLWPRASLSKLPSPKSGQQGNRPGVSGENSRESALDKSPRYGACDLRPLVFEIGLTGPYQVTSTGGALPPSPAYELPSPQCDGNAAGGAPQGPPTQTLAAWVHPPGARELDAFSPRQRFWFVAALLMLLFLLALNLTVVRRFLVAVAGTTGRTVFCLIGWLGVCCLRVFRRPNLAPRFLVWLARCVKGSLRLMFGKQPKGQRWRLRLRTGDLLLLLALLLTVLLAGIAVFCHGRDGEEPFSLLRGISVWPSLFLQWAAILLSITLVWKGLSDVDKDKDAVFRDAEIAPACPAEACRQGEETTQPGPSPRSRMETFDWRMMRVYKFAKDGTKRSNNIEPLLREYARMGKKRCRLARFLFGASLAMLFCVALLAGLDDYPNSPCRGAVTYWTVWILTYGALVAFLGIVFFVIDAMHLCQYFVRALGDDKHVRSEPRHRPDSPGQQSCRGLELAAAQPASDDEWLTPQCELAAVRLIANRTNVVGKLILYPVYVLLLLMIARYPLFDAWQFPLPLLITAGLVLFGLLAHSWRLRYLANEAKGNILARVRTLLTDAIEETTHQREQLKQLLDAIDKERAGAFRPWGEDYLIRALAIPLAGQGGFVLIDQLMSSMR